MRLCARETNRHTHAGPAAAAGQLFTLCRCCCLLWQAVDCWVFVSGWCIKLLSTKRVSDDFVAAAAAAAAGYRGRSRFLTACWYSNRTTDSQQQRKQQRTFPARDESKVTDCAVTRFQNPPTSQQHCNKQEKKLFLISFIADRNRRPRRFITRSRRRRPRPVANFSLFGFILFKNCFFSAMFLWFSASEQIETGVV